MEGQPKEQQENAGSHGSAFARKARGSSRVWQERRSFGVWTQEQASHEGVVRKRLQWKEEKQERQGFQGQEEEKGQEGPKEQEKDPLSIRVPFQQVREGGEAEEERQERAQVKGKEPLALEVQHPQVTTRRRVRGENGGGAQQPQEQ